MTLIPLLVTSGNFLITIHILDSSILYLLLYSLGLLRLCKYKFGTGLILVLYKFSLEF